MTYLTLFHFAKRTANDFVCIYHLPEMKMQEDAQTESSSF